jgi:Transposase DDE domain
MSYGRTRQAEAALAAEAAEWLERAAAADAADDAAHGDDRRGDELPDWVADQQARLARLRAAKAALEAEARTAPPPPDAEPGASSGMSDHGRPRRAPDGGPPDRAQRNFTDPDSRVMKTKDGFVQAYNGQLAVDAAHQIITAHRLTTNGNDQEGLVPLLEAITTTLGRTPRELSADAGFCREDNLEALAARGIRGYLAPGRGRHGRADPSGHRQLRPGSRMAAMAAKLKRAGRRSRYRLRKQTVEPVIGQIKHARGFRQFLLRGFAKVEAEWALVCTAHNLTKLLAARTA